MFLREPRGRPTPCKAYTSRAAAAPARAGVHAFRKRSSALRDQTRHAERHVGRLVEGPDERRVERPGDRPMSPSERLARMRALAARGLGYSRGSLCILLLGSALALGVAHNTRPVYRAECTVFAKARIRTDDRDDGAPSPDQ